MFALFRPVSLLAEHVRDALVAHGLSPLWHAVHHLLDYRVAGLILLLVAVQALWPANTAHRPLSKHLALDFLYPVANILIAATLFWPLLFAADDLSHRLWPTPAADLLRRLPGWAEFLVILLVLDFMHYLSHVLRHKIPWLWHFHSIHHSQVELNPATTFRTHVLDSLVAVLILTTAYGLIGSNPTPWIYAGITAQFWDMFIHSNVRTNLGPLGWLVVSPQYHRVHHSIEPEHADRNFSDRLVIWDLLFGTIVRDRDVYPDTGTHDTVRVRQASGDVRGIAGAWLRQTLHPFGRMAAAARSRRR